MPNRPAVLEPSGTHESPKRGAALSACICLCLLLFVSITAFGGDNDYDFLYRTAPDGTEIAYGFHRTNSNADIIKIHRKNGYSWETLKEGLDLKEVLYEKDERNRKPIRKGLRLSAFSKDEIKQFVPFHYDSLGLSIIAEGKDFRIPWGGWSNAAAKVVTLKNEDFLVLSLQSDHIGTYVIARDGKTLKVDHDYHPSEEIKGSTSVSGILSIPGILRKVDLQAFDAEVRRFQATDQNETVLDSENKPINSVAAVHKTYRDLVAQARDKPDAPAQEKVDPEIIKEIAEAIRAKRSAVLLGRAGTGKSSAVRAFAREVAAGRIKGIPRTLRIFEVPMSGLESGASLTGILDQRVSNLRAASRQGGIVYFIDEIHTMAGRGTHSNKAVDVTQDLKSEMELGNFIILGTDTDPDFRNAFGADPPFIDRFDTVKVREPEGQALIDLVRHRVKAEFKFDPGEEIVTHAVQLSTDLDVSTAQPRATVNLIKKAVAIMENEDLLDVPPTHDFLQKAAIKKYGVDPTRFDPAGMRAKIESLSSGLDEDLVGQIGLKKAVVSLFRRKLTGVGDPEQVISMLIYGPPGVGKTQVAKSAAKLMGYDSVVIEMNKYAEAGIEAFRREVYAELKKNPFTVFILDEIEKAALSVQEAALSLLQSGNFRVTESSGRREIHIDVRAKNALFLMTTNAASETRGALHGEALSTALRKGHISEPIVSRTQSKLYAGRPTIEEFREAARKYILQTIERESKNQQVRIEMRNLDEFLDWIAGKHEVGSDYRDVKNLVNETVNETIAEAVLHPDFMRYGSVVLNWHPAKLALEFTCVRPLRELASPSLIGN